MGFLVTFALERVCSPKLMQHSFLQKLVMVILAGALVAGGYEFVYKGIIVGADKALNGDYKKTTGTHTTPTPKRRY